MILAAGITYLAEQNNKTRKMGVVAHVSDRQGSPLCKAQAQPGFIFSPAVAYKFVCRRCHERVIAWLEADPDGEDEPIHVHDNLG